MITKCAKIFFLFIMAFSVLFIYNAEAKSFSVDSVFGVEKKLEGSELSSCESILGDVNTETDTAWLVQKLLNYLKILGPTIAIVLGSLDFAKAVINSDEESMKKAQGKFIKRIIAAVALFFVPILTQVLLGLFGITSDNASCGLK